MAHYLSKCPACGADAAEVVEFIRVRVHIVANNQGFRVRCRVCGYKGEYSTHRLLAMDFWNKNADRIRRKKYANRC